MVIHYSCESFYNIKDGNTPRVTSIAIKFLDSGQTKSFSIHKVAEKKKIPIQEIEDNFDELEKEMLKDFFKFLKVHIHFKFIHWNMRNITYGFEAIQHRYEVLGGKPFELATTNKVDLARLIYDVYGAKYASHPRLVNLIKKNAMSRLKFLTGADEAKSFENKEFIKLHQSTLRKVDILEDIFKRTAEGSLKTNSTWRDIYGITPQGLYELTKENWMAGIIFTLILVAIGVFIRSQII